MVNKAGKYKTEYGLIGRGISHSLSAEHFNRKFSESNLPTTYSLFNLSEINDLPSLLKDHPDLIGLNVTSPFKREVIEFLDELSPEAEALEAVNVIDIKRSTDGRLKLTGYNTDCEGFRQTLHGKVPSGTKALILGTGGASSAVAYALEKEGIPYKVVSRNPVPDQISYGQMTEILPNYKLVINATPLGMFPKIEGCPDIDFGLVSSSHFFYDLIYNPQETLFLKKAAEKGAKTKNGFEMLINQAELAWEIWNKSAKK